ncbi:MAG: hypothetical protein WD848_05340, partial [Dehalococcoidia bacterium]
PLHLPLYSTHVLCVKGVVVGGVLGCVVGLVVGGPPSVAAFGGHVPPILTGSLRFGRDDMMVGVMWWFGCARRDPSLCSG